MSLPIKFTFRTDGRYPVSASGKVRWESNREEAMKQAKAFDAHEFLELSSSGKILNTITLKSQSHEK